MYYFQNQEIISLDTQPIKEEETQEKNQEKVNDEKQPNTENQVILCEKKAASGTSPLNLYELPFFVTNLQYIECSSAMERTDFFFFYKNPPTLWKF